MKLPKEKKITFVAKGKFFSRFTDLLQNETGALEPSSCSVVRTSRFNPADFSNYLSKSLDNYVLFSSDSDFLPKYEYEHIPRDLGINRVSAEIVSEVIGAKSILNLNIGFDRVVSQIIRGTTISSQTESLVIDEKFNGDLNNYFFDPFVDNAPSYIDSYVRYLLEKVLDKLQGVDVDFIVLSGEYVWTNSSNSLLEILIRRNYHNTRIYVDKTGIMEALLSDTPVDSTLKMLHKSFFIPDFTYLGKNHDSYIEITNSDKVKIPLKDTEINVVPLKEEQVYMKSYDGKYVKNLLIGRGNLNSELELDNINYIERKDYVLNYLGGFSEFIVQNQGKYGIEIRKGDLNNIEQQALEGEFVESGQVVALASSRFGLNTNEYYAHKEGYVSFKYLKDGFIFIYPEREETYDKLKVKSTVVMRPRLVLGEDFSGFLNKNIKYISELNVDTYRRFIQSGAQAVICRSIDENSFWQVIREGWHKYCGLVILDGIGVKADSSRYVFDFLVQSPVVIDGTTQTLVLGFTEATDTFLKDIMPDEDSRYKVGRRVRVIDNQRWGEYVRIVSKKKNSVKVRSKNFNEIKIINLL